MNLDCPNLCGQSNTPRFFNVLLFFYYFAKTEIADLTFSFIAFSASRITSWSWVYFFYMLSGIKFVLFDTEFNEILSYPSEHCAFCKLMRSHTKTRRKCNYADRHSFRECEKQNSLIIYKCQPTVLAFRFILFH